ncbi:glycosyltransferase family 2 protein [Halobacteriovorax sp. CON-3]|uniref:glycosyltransferase family 2 protein n=1 Tax=Halobacteriovorax sp. CON-3 TaxID=3157710 RepID=UPI0037113E14
MKISILMSVYNGERTIDKALNSILNQTYTNFEVIIINDGSTDGSLEIINKYTQKDSRFIVVDNENQGLTKSLNTAYKFSSGELICRLDADDQYESIKLEKQLRFMKENPEVGLLGTNAKLESNGKIYAQTNCTFKDNKDVLNLLSKRKAFFCHSSWCMKRSVFETLNGYNEFFKKAQDYDFLLRALNITNISIIKDPLTILHISSQTISHDNENTQFIYATTALFNFYNKTIDLNKKYSIIYKGLKEFNFNKHYNNFLLALKIKRKLKTKKLAWIINLGLANITNALVGYLKIKKLNKSIYKSAIKYRENLEIIHKFTK